jgi:hypothetical protein
MVALKREGKICLDRKYDFALIINRTKCMASRGTVHSFSHYSFGTEEMIQFFVLIRLEIPPGQYAASTSDFWQILKCFGAIGTYEEDCLVIAIFHSTFID